MAYPVNPPVSPMLAKPVEAIPVGDYIYEPKWDGFRSIIFFDGTDVEIGSRNERPMTRYFPELVAAFSEQLKRPAVIDGEIVIVTGQGLDFDMLTNRIHPAESRVNKLAGEIPASFVAFDLLGIDDRDLRNESLSIRRKLLEELFSQLKSPLFITPASSDAEVAQIWFEKFEGAGLDGVIAKPSDVKYEEDKRVMFKIKHSRTADCVVAGYRVHKTGGVGSLLLGLYDDKKVLHHVGVCSSFTAARRKELEEFLAAYRMDDPSGHPWETWADADEDATQRQPGARSRWNATKNLDWIPLRPELIAEVKYEHMQRDRFRHVAHFIRWRDDRSPTSCTYEQLEEPVSAELQALFKNFAATGSDSVV